MAGRITAGQLDRLIRKGREKAFLLVDVRPAEAFCLDHIPGAVNVPLDEIEAHPFVHDDACMVIFYCRTGRRSKVAAMIAAEAGLADDRIYNLDGGIMGYAGEIILDPPRIEVLSGSWDRVVKKAIKLEKGAFLFYEKAAAIFAGTAAGKAMAKMQGDEKAHARLLFRQLSEIAGPGMGFHQFFERCRPDILEGGKHFDEVTAFLENTVNTEAVLDFALDLEYSAYDLYRAAAERSSDRGVKDLLLDLSQAEKTHISFLISCSGDDIQG